MTPRASRNAIAGYGDTVSGQRHLKVMVTAPPDGGRANAAVISLLAKAWRLPKSSFTLLVGATDRIKVLEIAGDPAALWDRLSKVLPEENSDD